MRPLWTVLVFTALVSLFIATDAEAFGRRNKGCNTTCGSSCSTYGYGSSCSTGYYGGGCGGGYYGGGCGGGYYGGGCGGGYYGGGCGGGYYAGGCGGGYYGGYGCGSSMPIMAAPHSYGYPMNTMPVTTSYGAYPMGGMTYPGSVGGMPYVSGYPMGMGTPVYVSSMGCAGCGG